MTPDLDICRAANLLVKHDGADTTVHAAMQADAMLDKGDLEGKRVWLRIMKAIEAMQRTEPGAGETAH